MKGCKDETVCLGRREFLVKTALLAGGLTLTLTGMASAGGPAFEDVVIPIDENSPLSKVGGSLIVDSPAGKVIVVHNSETTFVAYSAKCTHKGGIVSFDNNKNEFVCPKHGSTFNSADGKPTGGPAEDPLKSYPASKAAASVTVSIG